MFIFSPFAPVFAQEADPAPIPPDVAPPTETPIPENVVIDPETPPSSEKPPSEEILPPSKEIIPPVDEKPLVEEEPQAIIATNNPQSSGVSFKIPTQAQATVDQSTGALIYEYPISLPEGRNGMTPELSVRYNSRNATRPDTFTGLGWELSLPYIQRERFKGVQDIFSKAYFSSSISGNLIATTDTSSSQYTTYRPETDGGDYKKYTYNSDKTWTMMGKDGRTYTFGGTLASRQDNPGDSTQVYKWMVSKIADTQGNEIQYSYIKDSGQIYPSQILYTYHALSPAVNAVNFTYSTPTNYDSTSYNSAFPVTTYKLLDTIVVTTTVGVDVTTDTYNFNYADAQFLKQKTLSSIGKIYSFAQAQFNQSFGGYTNFTYSTKTPGWQSGTHSLENNYNYFDDTIYQDAYTADFDLNGYPDVLISHKVGNTVYNNKLLLNNGTTFIDSMSAWGLPSNIDYSYSYAIMDLNGDRLSDLEIRQDNTLPIYLNTGSGFIADTSGTWSIINQVPESTACGPNLGDSRSFDSNVFFYDINNDGKNDILYFGGSSDFRVYLNNGNGFTVSSAYIFTPASGASFVISNLCSGDIDGDKYQMLSDINGDGLADYYHQQYGTYLNTGSGFAYSLAYTIYITEMDRSGFADINGDNLLDYVGFDRYGSSSKCARMFINNGTGFTAVNPTTFPPCANSGVWDPVDLRYVNNDSSTWGSLIDATADGFPDIVGQNGTSNDGKVRSISDAKNTWILNPDPNIGGPDTWTQLITPAHGKFFDVNADGVLDYITPDPNFSGGTITTTKVGMGKPSVPNRLTKITSMLGAETLVEYATAPTNYNDTDISPMQVVKKIIVQNIGLSQPDMVTQYSYTNGSYTFDNITGKKRFAGFHKVTAAESGSDLAALRVSETYFHQANGSDSSTNEPTDTDLALVGKPYYIVTKHPSGTPKKEIWNKYGKQTLVIEPVIGRFSKFVYPTETVTKTTEANATTATADVYTFDTTLGEQIELRNMGFVTASTDGTYTDISGDTKYQFTEYANNPESTIVKPKRIDISTTSSSANAVARTDYYYDSQALGNIGTLGNLTKETKWVSGNGTTVADTTYTYDIFGNVLTTTNPRGALTTYVYDTTKSQVISETNHLNQTTNYEIVTGKITKITDPNGRIITYKYSNKGWLYSTTTQNTGGSPFNEQYVDEQVSNLWAVYSSTQIVDGSYDLSWQILDRLGRPVRIIRKLLNHNTEVSGDLYLKQVKSYDALGREATSSAPSSVTNPGYDYIPLTTASVPSNLVTTINYDVFDRPISIVNTLGATTISYAGVETTTTDANNKQKKASTDAYGNIVQAKEINGASTYTTNYTYDIRNLLTSLTDALGNVRNFTYNNAGWLTKSEDLHTSDDRAFGSSSFTYDLNGNQLIETQPNNTTITRVYDMLDRPKSIDSSTTTFPDFSIKYDSCLNGKGHICNLSGALQNNTPLYKSYVYGISGAPTSTTLTILGSTYTTNYLYNYSDKISKITYPNNTVVRYAFGDWALPFTTYITLPAGTENIYANTVYDFTEKPTTTTITNGPTITYTYDSAKLYRLTRKQASSGVGGSTTVSFYPTAGDGYIYHNNANWDTVHDATTGTSASYNTTTYYAGNGKQTSTSHRIRRAFIPFNTSSIPDGATITDAKLKVYVQSKLNNDNDGDDWLTVVQATEPSTTMLAKTDYDLAGNINTPTEGIDTKERKDITSIATGKYLIFNLNSTGKGWINTTGNTKLGIREGHDVIDSPFTGTSGQNDYIVMRGFEYTGTASDPTLEVTYNTGGGTYQDSNYTYDNVNNITQITEPNLTKAYTYDDLYRLTQAVHTPLPSGSPNTYTYTYNAIGNVTTGNGSSYTYSGANKTNPHAVTNIGVSAYTYDDNGNMITAPNQSLTYNWQNQPTLISLNETTNINMYYDENAERVIYQTPTNTEVQVDETYLVRNNVPEVTIKLGNTPIGTISNGAIYSVVADHLDTPIKQVNTLGTVSEDVTYDPFGKVISQIGSLNTKHGYTGHEEDIDTGLVYAEARYYNPTTLRFNQQDKSHLYLAHQNFNGIIGIDRNQLLLDPQQLNSYSYVRNNPINGKDPSGLLTVIIPGTNYDQQDYSLGGDSENFVNAVGKTFGEKPAIFDWSGENTIDAREKAAESLAKMIKDHKFADGEKLNLIGHSHGGNIAILASKKTDKETDTLVTIGTPNRTTYQPNYEKIKQHFNVYSSFDKVQRLGEVGDPLRVIGPNPRKFNGAENINAGLRAGVTPWNSHSNLRKKVSVWSLVDKKVYSKKK